MTKKNHIERQIKQAVDGNWVFYAFWPFPFGLFYNSSEKLRVAKKRYALVSLSFIPIGIAVVHYIKTNPEFSNLVMDNFLLFIASIILAANALLFLAITEKKWYHKKRHGLLKRY